MCKILYSSLPMIKKILPIAIFINFLIILISGYFVFNKKSISNSRNEDQKIFEQANISISKDSLKELSIINEIWTNESTNYIPNTLQYIKTKDQKYCKKISYNNERLDSIWINICKNSLLNGKINEIFLDKIIKSYSEFSQDDEIIELLLVANWQWNCSNIKRNLYRYLQCKKFLYSNMDISDLYIRIQKSLQISEDQYKKWDFSYIKIFWLDDEIIPLLKNLLKNHFWE